MTEQWDPEVPMGTREPSTRGFPVGLTLVTALAMLVLLTLGGWQLQRLAWKRDLLARIEMLQAAPARPIGPVLDALNEGRDVDFTRVSATCPGLAAAPFVELYGLRDGRAGTRLISACKVDALRYRTVLVDRGFVADIVSARPPVDPAATAPVTITGLLRSPEPASFVTPPNRADRFFSRDVEAMAAVLRAERPAPIFLMVETSSNPEWRALTPAPIPTSIPNRHLEYAGTWFGLAGALAAVYAAMLWRRRKA
ncbi:SURF1 family protein [Phenylobacterium sp. J367]|uniref:SURF1 family protein n=1 Tax=Phenylobacterium sp. J367 TaxID=2898435 RepID=UPI0021519FE6|nr:SURF1 family cytochrome oxidase biogenesis protein [Phenylobacterium sp. J367]MCR5877454.1 SURF1 family protein [Phenylobacterium sp. J367]